MLNWALVTAGVAALAILLYPVQALTVRPARGWSLLWAVPISTSSEFRLTWTHTVSGRSISETYVIDPAGGLCLREMVFDHEGPNLPAGPEEGLTWRLEGSKAIVSGYRLCLDRLSLAVAPSGHCLESGGWTWDLLAGAGPDRLLGVTVEREPLILVILTQVWHWLKSKGPL